VALLRNAVPLFEHNAHTAFYALHAPLQAQTDEDPEQHRKKQDREQSSPPALEKWRCLQHHR
jgi:hypothetical protein